MIKERYFFSTGSPCQNGCLYCFSQFNEDKLPVICYEKIASLTDSIIYPSCDGELYLDDCLVSLFEEYLKNSSHYNIFSFSTKRNLSSDELDYLKSINEQLIAKKTGEIKISVSITNKSRVPQLEPRAASYAERLNMMTTLSGLGILTSVILKPILPFITYDEYCGIIDDCQSYGMRLFVTGDLYVDDNSSFYKHYLNGNKIEPLEQRIISWLPHQPKWQKVKGSSFLKGRIIRYIQSKGLFHYNSDEELLKDIRSC